jgi:phosphoribosyl-ATP pyrophosphohydrolase
MVVVRGEREIKAAALEAQRAATRNGHKPDWRREPLCKLIEKLREEVDELEQAVVSGDNQRIREEAGDCIWTVTMIGDHDLIWESHEDRSESFRGSGILPKVFKALRKPYRALREGKEPLV